MKKLPERLWRLRTLPVGPLKPYLDLFAWALIEQGYKKCAINRKIRTVASFSRWLDNETIILETVSESHVRLFLDVRYPSDKDQARSISMGVKSTLRRLVLWLRQQGLVQTAEPTPAKLPIHWLLDAFTQYLTMQCALSPRTSKQYCPVVELFLRDRFGDHVLELEAISTHDVIEFVKKEAKRLSPARARVTTIALRSYFRYLRALGVTRVDLEHAVPAVPNWAMTAIPRAIEQEHVHAILAACDRNTKVGRRDYAVLMLLSRLGLRGSEVVNLTLDDIDWQKATVTVCGKSRAVTTDMPMPIDVGTALSDYLQHGRPQCATRSVFLRVRAPIRELASATSVTSIVNSAITRAGVETRTKGTHQFRHAVAVAMLRRGATLTEIGGILRHRHSKTTGIYAKVDFIALRTLSVPWPGAAR